MVQINLSEFSGYELPQLLEFITLQNETEYNVKFPKKTMAGIDGNFFVFRECLDAAYVGQQLWQISTFFNYTVPCVKKPGYFSFQVTVYDKVQLAVTLYFLANGLDSKIDSGLLDEFNNGPALLLEDAFNGKKDTACWGLIWIANLFLCRPESNYISSL